MKVLTILPLAQPVADLPTKHPCRTGGRAQQKEAAPKTLFSFMKTSTARVIMPGAIYVIITVMSYPPKQHSNCLRARLQFG